MLTLIGYIVMNAFVMLIYFRNANRRLHPLETVMSWIIASMVFQNYTALFYMNFELIMIPEKLSLELAHLLNRLVLYPVCLLLYLNRYASLPSLLGKSAWTAASVLFFTGFEWLAHWQHVLIHVPEWKLWWSLAFWTLFVLVNLLVHKLFRHRLNKELADA